MFLLGSGLGVEFLRLSLSLASAPLCLLHSGSPVLRFSGSPLRSEYVYSRCCSVSTYWFVVWSGDAPRAWQHARICAEGQLRAQSPMRRSASPTGRWRSDARSSATSATQPIQLPTHSDRSPLPTARIGPKLGRNIEHWWYDGSPANRSAAIPQSLAISQDIYLWLQGSHSARGHSGLKQTTSQVQSSADWSSLQIRATPDVACRVTRPKSEI